VEFHSRQVGQLGEHGIQVELARRSHDYLTRGLIDGALDAQVPDLIRN
jgi:hypothetical protein